ncbi:pilus assembly protein TadG-related protein [Sandarakinorhabdus sp. AAP62]|uniref:pilus assembly protein TadG-related protein n=1 Tax=Sandarakinorhabdus sp. AAP62 TaxID=1248916 RepID=UPI00031DAD4B|nr:pilus assembly protein TadG-related protein [Sandarakinorhabdus sp. AAP62]
MSGRQKARRGSIALAGALMLLPLSLLAGMAIDFGRAWAAQDQLAQAVDAAALAGVRQLGAGDHDREARQFFTANMANVDDVTVSSLSIAPAADNQTLTVSASAGIATTFLALAGDDWQQLTISATARARRSTMAMELALVLDVSGEMVGTPISSLRQSATELINILFGSKTVHDSLFVAVVPYAATVNFGPNRSSWLQGGAATGFAPFRWRGCVEARPGGEDQTDTPPASAPFEPFRYPSTRAQTAVGAFGVDRKSGNPVFGDADWGTSPAIISSETPDPDDSDSQDPAQMWTDGTARKGPNVGCGQPIAGLSNDKTALLRIVSLLQATSRGGTMGHLGLQAGWMTISPRWRGLWGSNVWGTTTPAGLPLDYRPPGEGMAKVIVLMTSGETNWFDHSRPPSFDYTAFGRVAEDRLGTRSGNATPPRLNDRFASLCEAIKARGITIYTIMLGRNRGGQNLYRQCATSSAHAFYAPDASQLRASFTEIGGQLANVRLER